MQIEYTRDIERAHFGKAPKLRELANAYGRNTTTMWLEIQLNDLSEFAGCKEKLTPRKIQETAAMIAETYPHYSLTELMLFFQRFKRCRYGRFYGIVDPMKIMQALSEFAQERRQAYAKREKRKAQQAAEAENRKAEELKQRYMQRVPDAFTEQATLSFLQYRLMGYDTLSDAELQQELSELSRGRKKIPAEVQKMLQILKRTFT